MTQQRTEHHVWCNFYNCPVESCKMCERLFDKYPYGEGQECQDEEDLALKYFPKNVRVR